MTRIITYKQMYMSIRDRLGELHENKGRYQAATFMDDAIAVGRHLHSLCVAAGSDHWTEMTPVATITEGSEYSSLLTAYPRDVAEVKAIWLLDDDSKLLQPLPHRYTERTDIWSGSFPSWEQRDGKIYWFPQPVSEFKVRLEYVEAFARSAEANEGTPDISLDTIDFKWDSSAQSWTGKEGSASTSETEYTKHLFTNEPPIPDYAEGYMLDELTVRAAMALGRDPSPWMTLAMRSREAMLLASSRKVKRRNKVLYRGR